MNTITRTSAALPAAAADQRPVEGAGMAFFKLPDDYFSQFQLPGVYGQAMDGINQLFNELARSFDHPPQALLDTHRAIYELLDSIIVVPTPVDPIDPPVNPGRPPIDPPVHPIWTGPFGPECPHGDMASPTPVYD